LSELANIVSAWETAIANREEIAMATVIRTEGSSYRKPGAWMLVTRDGTRVGTISGGCLEAEVARRIWWLTEKGACIRRYSTDGDEDAKDGYGLGCGGAIHLLLERHCELNANWRVLKSILRERHAGCLVSVARSTHPQISIGMQVLQEEDVADSDSGRPPELVGGIRCALATAFCAKQSIYRSIQHESFEIDIFCHYITPPIGIVVFGSGDDVRPLTLIGHTLGWEVTVVAVQTPVRSKERFPSVDSIVVLSSAVPVAEQIRFGPFDATVLMTHSYEVDCRLLRELLPMNLPYIGVLGPQRRTLRALADLGIEATPGDNLIPSSLRSPVGLRLGGDGDGPGAIALSIAAEIQTVFNRSHPVTPSQKQIGVNYEMASLPISGESHPH
jgi:xanthine/CO dehydrogenase XdhC/CoxF family maturation factor